MICKQGKSKKKKIGIAAAIVFGVVLLAAAAAFVYYFRNFSCFQKEKGYDCVNMAFIFNWKKYKFSSFCYADIQDMGYYLTSPDDEIEVEEDEEVIMRMEDESNESVIEVGFWNPPGNGKKNITDCEISSISFNYAYFDSYDMFLDNGVRLGMEWSKVREAMDESTNGKPGQYSNFSYSVIGDTYENTLILRFLDGRIENIKLKRKLY